VIEENTVKSLNHVCFYAYFLTLDSSYSQVIAL